MESRFGCESRGGGRGLRKEEGKPDHRGAEPWNQVSPFPPSPSTGDSENCLPAPLTPFSTYMESGLLRTQGFPRTKPCLCHLHLTQPGLLFSTPYHVPRDMGTRQ